jgi:hypothetical protein
MEHLSAAPTEELEHYFTKEVLQSLLILSLKIAYQWGIQFPRLLKIGILVLLIYWLIQILWLSISFFIWLKLIVFNFLKSIFFILSRNKYYIFMIQCLPSNNFILDRVALLRNFILSTRTSLHSYAGTIQIFLTWYSYLRWSFIGLFCLLDPNNIYIILIPVLAIKFIIKFFFSYCWPKINNKKVKILILLSFVCIWLISFICFFRFIFNFFVISDNLELFYFFLAKNLLFYEDLYLDIVNKWKGNVPLTSLIRETSENFTDNNSGDFCAAAAEEDKENLKQGFIYQLYKLFPPLNLNSDTDSDDLESDVDDDDPLNKQTKLDIVEKQLETPSIDPNDFDYNKKKSIIKWVNDIVDIQFINLHKSVDLIIKKDSSNQEVIVSEVLKLSSWELPTPSILKYILINSPEGVDVKKIPETKNLLYKFPTSILEKMEEFNTFDSKDKENIKLFKLFKECDLAYALGFVRKKFSLPAEIIMIIGEELSNKVCTESAYESFNVITNELINITNDRIGILNENNTLKTDITIQLLDMLRTNLYIIKNCNNYQRIILLASFVDHHELQINYEDDSIFQKTKVRDLIKDELGIDGYKNLWKNYDPKGFNNTYYYSYDQKNFRLKYTPYFKNKDLSVNLNSLERNNI